MDALLKSENVNYKFEVEEGDAGIILKKDGTFRVFNTHANLDPKALTPRQIEQGKQILGLSAALQLPELMEILVNAASDPTLFKKTIDYTRQ